MEISEYYQKLSETISDKWLLIKSTEETAFEEQVAPA